MNTMTSSTGYAKLATAVMRDCEQEEKCFNPDGCSKGAGVKSKCFHRYCDKFKWILDRVQHYAEKTGIPANEILDALESSRDYWYMNYYQESRQPKIGEAKDIKIFDDANQFRALAKDSGFRCPKCGHISKHPVQCDSGKCDWKAYGLFGTLGKGLTVVLKQPFSITEIFMPVEMEHAQRRAKRRNT